MSTSGITLDPAPHQGSPSLLTATTATGSPWVGATVRVVHRPGLHGEREVALGITDSQGQVSWTPELAGTATVEVNAVSTPVVIGSSSLPADLAVPMGLIALAAAALVGYALRPTARS